MTEEQRKRIAHLTNANKQIKEIYALLDELGIKYQKTQCSKCRKDLMNILREEAGLIGDASAESDFNAKDIEIDWSYTYEYIFPHPIWWHGHKICQETPREVIEEFVHYIPQGYYRKVKAETPQETNNEETINENGL